MQTSNQRGIFPSSISLPKVNSPQLTKVEPPPAYTPQRLCQGTISSDIFASRATAARLQRAQPTAILNDTAAEDYHDADSLPSAAPVSLRINSSVNVAKSDNLVCLAATPADHANAIAQAVVRAIQENSAGQCGIPMIDEDGHPRPIHIEVDASLTVDGERNVVGNQRVIDEVVKQRGELRRRRVESEADDCSQTRAPAKRRRFSH